MNKIQEIINDKKAFEDVSRPMGTSWEYIHAKLLEKILIELQEMKAKLETLNPWRGND